MYYLMTNKPNQQRIALVVRAKDHIEAEAYIDNSQLANGEYYNLSGHSSLGDLVRRVNTIADPIGSLEVVGLNFREEQYLKDGINYYE